MQISTDLGGNLQSYLDLSSAELKLTAGNMANIDTPGYRTEGFNFDEAMKSAVARQNNPADPSHALNADASLKVTDIDGLISRPDGNNVSMDREGMNMAGAQLKFRAGVELLKREYARVSEAIHSDMK